MTIKRYTDSSKDVLILRACAPDLTSRDGFKYPSRGPVADPKWQPTHGCGSGLHGWLWGRGDDSLIPDYARSQEAKWLVIAVPRDQIIDLGGKVKFPGGNVVFCGTKHQAGRYVADRRPLGLGLFNKDGYGVVVHRER